MSAKCVMNRLDWSSKLDSRATRYKLAESLDSCVRLSFLIYEVKRWMRSGCFHRLSHPTLRQCCFWEVPVWLTLYVRTWRLWAEGSVAENKTESYLTFFRSRCYISNICEYNVLGADFSFPGGVALAPYLLLFLGPWSLVRTQKGSQFCRVHQLPFLSWFPMILCADVGLANCYEVKYSQEESTSHFIQVCIDLFPFQREQSTW